ncbi:uncharacterized protein FOMMEDRAFT_23277 [Fomitiporia mediterranea MF3/22]|uniref:uncharacterized protein n=1 Tax=Fomitiporia mediterranea (strain MF3/22) TaxID=694068 RepID=UPI00044087AB|nr:uncharacterized protein FOMMEDRAFT_23277 [Fomitiporia mediterranea MF3/22]EJC98875.1 hypothetical protein FOMMEDRAFT_23277 [Fomitiporia mediterranea MF3/22]
MSLHGVDPANIPSPDVNKYKALFIFLQVFGGQIGMPLFVGTMLLSSSVKRHLTLVNFCVSWIIYSIVYCLTIYHDVDRFTGVASRLCVAQAGLVHGVVPLAVVTYCSLHIQVWMGVRCAFDQSCWLQTHKKKVLITLFIAPYVVFIAFSVGALVMCLKYPDLIDRTGSYYCTINYNPLVYAVPGFAAGVIAIMIILEIIIGITLVRRWKAVRSSQRLNAASISMIVRIAIFSVYGFATLAACAAFLARSLSIWPYLVQASLPTAVFLMFGTRRDVWQAWCFWQRHQPSHYHHRSTSSSSSSSAFIRTRRYPSHVEPLSIRVTLDTETQTSSADSEKFNSKLGLGEKKQRIGSNESDVDISSLEKGKVRRVEPGEVIVIE